MPKLTRRQILLTMTASPLALAALPGCDSGRVLTPGSTNPPPVTPGPVQTFAAPMDFGNGQSGTLNLQVQDNNATGSLIVNAPASQQVASSRAFTITIPPNTYPLSGTFTPPNSFNVNGTFPDALGGPFTITGTTPTQTQAGTFNLAAANGQSTSGVIPIPGAPPTPPPTPDPTYTVKVTPEKANVEKGGAATFAAEVTPAPGGTLRYRWFIAAPVAYVVEQSGQKRQGQDIETDQSSVKVQTGAPDEGKLTLRVHVFRIGSDGTRTFLGEGSATVEIPDIRALDVTWVEESAPNKYNNQTLAYFWEFPYVPGAKEYRISINRATPYKNVYRMLQVDVDRTPVTTIPILTGDDPFPPRIPINAVEGLERDNFYRRGTGIRWLVVWGSGFDPNFYKENNPISVLVSF